MSLHNKHTHLLREDLSGLFTLEKWMTLNEFVVQLSWSTLKGTDKNKKNQLDDSRKPLTKSSLSGSLKR